MLLIVCRPKDIIAANLDECRGPDQELSARESVATNLKALRLCLGLSQEDFAHRAGVHRTYVGSVERGERNASIDTIERSIAERAVVIATPAKSRAPGAEAAGVEDACAEGKELVCPATGVGT
jgi:DNA-binding XRE family transcriptional regulator